MTKRKKTVVSCVAKCLLISPLVIAVSFSAAVPAAYAAAPTAVAQGAVGLPDGVLYYLNGQKASKYTIENLAPENIAHMNVLKGGSVQQVLGNVPEKQAILVTTKGNESAAAVVELNKKLNRSVVLADKLLLIDDKEVTRAEFERLLPSQIQQITVLSPEKAVEAYGEKGKNGAAQITTK
jgi:predicted peptidase